MLRVFEHRVLREILGAKRDDVRGQWRKLCYDPHCLLNIMIKSRMRWAGHVASMGRREYIHGFGGKPERKRILGRPKRGWEDNIKINL
jgi:hypothetical protein